MRHFSLEIPEIWNSGTYNAQDMRCTTELRSVQNVLWNHEGWHFKNADPIHFLCSKILVPALASSHLDSCNLLSIASYFSSITSETLCKINFPSHLFDQFSSFWSCSIGLYLLFTPFKHLVFFLCFKNLVLPHPVPPIYFSLLFLLLFLLFIWLLLHQCVCC